MADIHVISANDAGDIYSVAFHFVVPSVVNAAGINYRTLVSRNFTASVLKDISPAENTQLQNGELLEEVTSFATHPGRIDQVDRLKAMYQDRKLYWQTAIPIKYKYAGATLAGA